MTTEGLLEGHPGFGGPVGPRRVGPLDAKWSMAISYSMAITTIKSTYSLDVASVRTLETLAQRWNVSKSEVLRRALRIAATTSDEGETTPLETLTRLQATVRERGVDLAEWRRDLREERRASGRRLDVWPG